MFRFTIRDLLWLMVVVGLATALAATRLQFVSVQQEIDHQRERLLYADVAIMGLAEGWKKDRPDRIEFDGDFITINGDGVAMSFGRPRRHK